MDKKERNLKIKALRDEGHTLAEIGQTFGIRPERVREICRRFEMREKRKKEAGPIMAGLPLGIMNALKRSGICNDYDLIKSIETQSIYKVRNIGKARMEVIFQTMREVNNGKQ